MKMNKVTAKIISVIISGMFMFQQVAMAADNPHFQSGNPLFQERNIYGEEKSIPENIYIPTDLAQIESKKIGDNDNLIFNLQDCHSSLSAQYSIVNILNRLLNDYDINIVAIEGASGYIDTSLLKSFPDKEVKKEAASALMKEGKLSAGEFFSVITDKDIALYGVEDKELYYRNLESFRKIHGMNKYVLGSVKKIINEIEKAEEKTYSKELSMFIFKSRLHEAGKISFEVYSRYLIKLCGEKGIEPGRVKNIKGFLEAVRIEKEVDFDKATLERKRLLSDLMSGGTKSDLEEMVLKTLDFNEDKIGPVEYHDWLFSFARSKGKYMDEYEELVKYALYIKYYQTLDVIGLQSEMEILERKLLDKLFSTGDEVELYRQSKLYRAIESLFSIQIMPEDVSFLKDNLEKIDSRSLQKVLIPGEYAEKIKDSRVDITDIRSRAVEAIDFYRLAERRNAAMLSNTIKSMASEGKHMAALISGGHHSRGLSGLMRDKGVSYFILMPKYADDSERPYVAVLTRKKGPYMELMNSGAYDLALEAYFDTGDIDELHEVIALVLGGWVIDKDIDIENVLEAWADSYGEYYRKIPDFRRKDMRYSPLEPEEFRRFLSQIKISGKKDNSCEVLIGDKVFVVDNRGEGHGIDPDLIPLNIGIREKDVPKKVNMKGKYSGLHDLFKKVKGVLRPGDAVLFPGVAAAIKPYAVVMSNIFFKGIKADDGRDKRRSFFEGGSHDGIDKPVFILHEFSPFELLSGKEMLVRGKRVTYGDKRQG